MNASELATLGNAMLERSSIPVKFEFICDSLGSLYRVISIAISRTFNAIVICKICIAKAGGLPL